MNDQRDNETSERREPFTFTDANDPQPDAASGFGSVDDPQSGAPMLSADDLDEHGQVKPGVLDELGRYVPQHERK